MSTESSILPLLGEVELQSFVGQPAHSKRFCQMSYHVIAVYDMNHA